MVKKNKKSNEQIPNETPIKPISPKEIVSYGKQVKSKHIGNTKLRILKLLKSNSPNAFTTTDLKRLMNAEVDKSISTTNHIYNTINGNNPHAKNTLVSLGYIERFYVEHLKVDCYRITEVGIQFLKELGE